MDAVDPTLFRLAIFVLLAVFFRRLLRRLELSRRLFTTPLMAVTNAISSVIIVGAASRRRRAYGLRGWFGVGFQGRRRRWP